MASDGGRFVLVLELIDHASDADARLYAQRVMDADLKTSSWTFEASEATHYGSARAAIVARDMLWPQVPRSESGRPVKVHIYSWPALVDTNL